MEYLEFQLLDLDYPKTWGILAQCTKVSSGNSDEYNNKDNPVSGGS